MLATAICVTNRSRHINALICRVVLNSVNLHGKNTFVSTRTDDLLDKAPCILDSSCHLPELNFSHTPLQRNVHRSAQDSVYLALSAIQPESTTQQAPPGRHTPTTQLAYPGLALPVSTGLCSELRYCGTVVCAILRWVGWRMIETNNFISLTDTPLRALILTM